MPVDDVPHCAPAETTRGSTPSSGAHVSTPRGPLAIACNFADRANAIPLDVGAGAHVLTASDHGVALDRDVLRLPAKSAAITERG